MGKAKPVWLSKEVITQLDAYRVGDESYNSVIKRILEKLNQATKTETQGAEPLPESRKQPFISQG